MGTNYAQEDRNFSGRIVIGCHVTAGSVEPVNANRGGTGTPAGWQVVFANSGSENVAVRVIVACVNIIP